MRQADDARIISSLTSTSATTSPLRDRTRALPPRVSPRRAASAGFTSRVQRVRPLARTSMLWSHEFHVALLRRPMSSMRSVRERSASTARNRGRSAVMYGCRQRDALVRRLQHAGQARFERSEIGGAALCTERA